MWQKIFFSWFTWQTAGIFFPYICNFLQKNDEFNEKIKILCEKPGCVKITITPKLLGNFEFCKKHWFRNLSGLLNVKFQSRKLKDDFLKNILTFHKMPFFQFYAMSDQKFPHGPKETVLY